MREPVEKFRRTREGESLEALLGSRGTNRALRLSDLETTIATQVMSVLTTNASTLAGEAIGGGSGGSLDMGDRITGSSSFDGGARV
jgi:hypothetical protein